MSSGNTYDIFSLSNPQLILVAITLLHLIFICSHMKSEFSLFFGTVPVYYVGKPEMTKQILVKEFQKFSNKVINTTYCRRE